MPSIDHIQENVPLAQFTTLKIGGPARYFVEAESEIDIIKAFEFARDNEIDLFVLGGGSNILVSDDGIDALVAHIAIKGIVDDETSGKRIITVGAGEDWDEFVAYSVENGLAGVECLSGIPGLVGGTPIQNVGAYGQDVSESIVSVRCLDRVTGEIMDLSNQDCGFSYRKSIFNSTHQNRFIVLAVTYVLNPNGPPKIEYKDLKEFFGGREATLSEVRNAVLDIRRAKSMVIDPNDPNSQSAGSFFKNPEISEAKYSELALAAVNARLGNVPSFPARDDLVKVPAAWLIENSGFTKGYRRGNAAVSANHALAIVNLGGASAAEIIDLKREVQNKVFEKFAVELRVEPIFVGFDQNSLAEKA